MILVYNLSLTILCKMSFYYWIDYNIASVPKVTNNNFSKKRVYADNTLCNFFYFFNIFFLCYIDNFLLLY